MRLFSASLPVFRQTLGNLRYIVQKGINDAQARGYAPQVLMLTRLAPDMLDDAEDRDITMPTGQGQNWTLRSEDYLQHWALPNLFFHITTAYAILRHNGVQLNKHDYLYGPGG